MSLWHFWFVFGTPRIRFLEPEARYPKWHTRSFPVFLQADAGATAVLVTNVVLNSRPRFVVIFVVVRDSLQHESNLNSSKPNGYYTYHLL
jgi:hypothetical protein